MIVENWIGGAWRPSHATETVPVLNPATQEILAYTPLGTLADVEAYAKDVLEENDIDVYIAKIVKTRKTIMKMETVWE